MLKNGHANMNYGRKNILHFLRYLYILPLGMLLCCKQEDLSDVEAPIEIRHKLASDDITADTIAVMHEQNNLEDTDEEDEIIDLDHLKHRERAEIAIQDQIDELARRKRAGHLSQKEYHAKLSALQEEKKKLNNI